MKVTNDMILPELRIPGILYRLILQKIPILKIKFPKPAPQKRKNRTNTYNHFLYRPDGSHFRVLVKKPGKKAEKVPGLLWIHGGGYATGMPEMIYASMANQAFGKCVVAAPDYCLSVEKPFPAALKDCYQTLEWMAENAQELGINPDQIFVGGESAGGGLTAALCLYARDQGKISIACQMPLYPMLDHRMDTASMKENNAPVWNEKQNEKAWAMYLKDLPKSQIPIYASPARAGCLEGLPPAISFVGTIEPFFDETADYMNKLRAAGIPVKFKKFQGCYHAFDMIVPWSKSARYARVFFKTALDEAVKHCHNPQK